MNTRLRRALEITFVLVLMGLSLAILLFREKLEGLGNVGYAGLFLLCFLANAAVLVPSPSLMIAASCALILNPVPVAAVAALGSTLGEFTGYGLGRMVKEHSPRFQKLVDFLTRRIRSQTLLVFLLALLPLPLFDVVGIYSGGSRMAPIRFSLACYAGKFLKLLCYTKMYDILELLNITLPTLP